MEIRYKDKKPEEINPKQIEMEMRTCLYEWLIYSLNSDPNNCMTFTLKNNS